MTYINVVGDWEQEYLTLWTGGANYGGTMDPGRFHIEVHGSSSPGHEVGHERKYFDWRASEKHGIAIYRPLTSGARRNTVPTGYIFSKPVSTIRGQMPVNSMSSGSSSERNGTHVGPDGKPSEYLLPNKHYRKDHRGPAVGTVRLRKLTCPEGYELVMVKGKPLCRPIRSGLPGKRIKYRVNNFI